MIDGIAFNPGRGFIFSKQVPKNVEPFDRVFGIFKELLTHTSGDLDEAFDWLMELDKEYQIFSADYSLEQFKEDLVKRGYLREEFEPLDGDENGDGEPGESRTVRTAKLEAALREHALDQIFGKLKKSGAYNHRTTKLGADDRWFCMELVLWALSVAGKLERSAHEASYQYEAPLMAKYLR